MPVEYCPACGTANEVGRIRCFACQRVLAGREPVWSADASQGMQQNEPAHAMRQDQWEIDQPTGPLTEFPARPVPEHRHLRRRTVVGLAAGGLAGVAALAALSWLKLAPPAHGSGLRPLTAPATSVPPTPAAPVVNTDQPGQLVLSGGCSLLQLAWHPSASLLAASVQVNKGSYLYLWDGSSKMFTQLLQLPAVLGTQSLAWIPGGSLLALAKPGSIELGASQAGHYVSKGSVLTLPASDNGSYPHSLAWLPDARHLLYTSGRGVFSWNLANGQETNLIYSQHKADPSPLVAGTYLGLWLSPDGRYAASTSNLMTKSADGTNNDSQILNPLHIWRVGEDRALVKIMAPRNGFTRLQWSPDSRYLVYGNNIQGLQVYDVQKQQAVITRHFPYPFIAIDYSPLSAWLMNGRYVALPQYIGTNPLPIPMLQVSEVATGRVVYTLQDHHYPIACSVSHDNQLVVAYAPEGPASTTNLLVWYDATSGKELASKEVGLQVNDLQWMSHGPNLALSVARGVASLTLQVYGP